MGATWLSEASPKPLQNLVLITLYERVQRRDVGREGGPVYIRATFKGHALLSGDGAERKVRLSYANVRLTPANRCPVVRP